MSGFCSWNSRTLCGAYLRFAAGYHSGSSSYPNHWTLYCRFLRCFRTAKTFSTSQVASPSTSIGGGGSLCCPGSGSFAHFRSRSGGITGCTLIEAGKSILYELPTCSRILYGPAIWLPSLRLGRSVFQFFVETQTRSLVANVTGFRFRSAFLFWAV